MMRSLVAWMLARAAGTSLGRATGDAWPRDDAAFDRHVQWVIDGGLGPLLRHVAESAGAALPARWQVPLLGADLTARVRHGNFVVAAGDVVDVCRAHGVTPVLLKGIATGGQWYPQAHFRPMGDVDVLVPADAHADVEAALVARGFVASGSPALHHGAPLWHPDAGVRVEIHRDLFGADSILSAGTTFARERVLSETVASTFDGRPVLLLAPELQIVYTASSLMADLIRHDVDPTFLPTLADAVLLLRARARDLDWERVGATLDNRLARTSADLLLGYLAAHGLADVAAATLARIGPGPGRAGLLERAAFRLLMDRYFLGARRWDLPLRPPVPGRYTVRRQFENRILRKRRGILEPG